MQTLAQLYRVNETNLALRRDFMRLSARDMSVLKKLDKWSVKVAAPIAKEFYDHQFSFGPTRSFFTNYSSSSGHPLDQLRQGLEKAQAGYFRQIFEEAAGGGQFGVSYFERRLQAGKLHNTIDLPFKWYIGSYPMYFDLARKHLKRRYPHRPRFRARAERAILVVMNADMQAIVEAFYFDTFQAMGVDLTRHQNEGLLRLSLGERTEVEIRSDAEPLPVEIDASLFEQALLNLALNARDAMPEGGKLTLSLSRAKPDVANGRPFVQLEVADTGKGMDEETCTRAFEPFFTTKERDRGTGLGLAAVWGIIARADGETRLTSSLGAGTTVTILLPEATGQIAEPAASPSQAAPAKATGETVLILEDEPAVRALASRVLTAAGYTCLTARSGTQALGIAAHHAEQIDLLLTDIVIPGIPSRDLAERLRARYPSLRVLATSGYAGEEIADIDTIGKNTPFLPKPFTPEILLQAVRQTLDPSQ